MLPQTPMHGMGPRMMPPGIGGRNPMMGMNRMPRNPMMNLMGGPPQLNRSGGFLSRLFGRGNPGGGFNPFMGMPAAGRAAGGSMFPSGGNPGGLGGLANFLNNTQQVIKTAQTIGPMVQQYGPIIRNLPAMWKLYRGLKNVPDQPEKETESPAKERKKQPKTANERSESSSEREEKQTLNKRNYLSQRKENEAIGESKKGASIPKLYI